MGAVCCLPASYERTRWRFFGALAGSLMMAINQLYLLCSLIGIVHVYVCVSASGPLQCGQLQQLTLHKNTA